MAIEVPYYRNSGIRIGNFTIGELTRALDDSSAFFDGPASDSQKQQILETMVQSAQTVITPLRKQGYVFSIGRSYSEGASNHGQGNTFDLVSSGDPTEAYSLAMAVLGMKNADQIWIEATDGEGNFHTHVQAAASGFNDSPDLQTIMDFNGGSGSPGLSYMEHSITSASTLYS